MCEFSEIIRKPGQLVNVKYLHLSMAHGVNWPGHMGTHRDWGPVYML